MTEEEHKLIHEIIHRMVIANYLLGKASEIIDDQDFTDSVMEYYNTTNEVLNEYGIYKNLFN